MLDQTIERFNQAAKDLQSTEFRLARTPAERQRENSPKREYSKLLNAVIPVINAFASEPRTGVASKLNWEALGTLRTFAGRAAVLAYRRQSPDLIRQGLIALAILGEVDDPCDLTFSLATLHHSALKLGIDTPSLFAEVASLSPPTTLKDWMLQFPLRPPAERDLKAFRLREITTKEGFDFIQDSLDRLPRKWWQLRT